jgi:hypothetical protein
VRHGVIERGGGFRVDGLKRLEEVRGPALRVHFAFKGPHDETVPADAEGPGLAIDRRQERWRNVYRRGHEYSMNIFNQTRKSGVSTRRGDECYAVDNTPP